MKFIDFMSEKTLVSRWFVLWAYLLAGLILLNGILKAVNYAI